MRKETFIVRGGDLTNRMFQYIERIDPKKLLDITIQQHRNKRSGSQNALMWKWINEVTEYVVEHTGMDNDEYRPCSPGRGSTSGLVLGHSLWTAVSRWCHTLYRQY